MFNRFSNDLGIRFFVTYLSLYYIAPFAVGYFFDYSYLNIYKGSPQYMYVLPAIFIYFFVFIFVHSVIPQLVTPLRRLHIRSFSRPYLNLIIMTFFLYLSVRFYYQYGLSYRQTGDAITESAGYVSILSILKIYFSIFLLLKLADISFDFKITKVDTITIIIGGSAFYFATSAAFDILKILVAFLILWYIFVRVNFFAVNFKELRLGTIFLTSFALISGFLAILFLV